ncbi:MAG: haloacid dehalogenase [Promethearchaeota archaeon]|nr:MAG: haloacid dehalogenase [Candidatus Lokiarchaeota archaeon]
MFDEIFEGIRKKLNMDDEIREETLKICRQSIRLSQEAVKSTHRGEFKKAKEKLEENQKMILDLESHFKNVSPRLYYKGYVMDMQQEFVEATLFFAFIKGEPKIPSPEDLSVSKYAYLYGLGDVVGELRRHALDAVRNENTQEADRCLDLMEEIYTLLLTLDYPDGLIPGIRRKTDVARSLIEKTRNDIAYFHHGNKLVNGMNSLLKKLKSLNTKED